MGKIILFDDEENTLTTFVQLFKDLEISNELVTCSTIEKYRKAIGDNEIKSQLRGLILDLAKEKVEADKGEFEISTDIQTNFDEYRIPIFIHSANLIHYDEFETNGTVFKIEKSKDSVETVCKMIKLMEESGFIEIFAPGGTLELEIMKNLHESFTKQFRNNEIKQIIEVADSKDTNYKKRVRNIFSRIAIRALLQKLMDTSQIEIEKPEDIRFNVVEHFYRRITNYKAWTGDIFKQNDSNNYVYILTPRCDIATKGINGFLTCKITDDTFTKENLLKKLNNNPQYSGAKFRYLPANPLFVGGKLDLSKLEIFSEKDLQDNFSYEISVSDELANDISGKLGSYYLRTGLPDTNIDEAIKYLSE